MIERAEKLVMLCCVVCALHVGIDTHYVFYICDMHNTCVCSICRALCYAMWRCAQMPPHPLLTSHVCIHCAMLPINPIMQKWIQFNLQCCSQLNGFLFCNFILHLTLVRRLHGIWSNVVLYRCAALRRPDPNGYDDDEDDDDDDDGDGQTGWNTHKQHEQCEKIDDAGRRYYFHIDFMYILLCVAGGGARRQPTTTGMSHR